MAERCCAKLDVFTVDGENRERAIPYQEYGCPGGKRCFSRKIWGYQKSRLFRKPVTIKGIGTAGLASELTGFPKDMVTASFDSGDCHRG